VIGRSVKAVLTASILVAQDKAAQGCARCDFKGSSTHPNAVMDGLDVLENG
jgi:hypothetical protein